MNKTIVICFAKRGDPCQAKNEGKDCLSCELGLAKFEDRLMQTSPVKRVRVCKSPPGEPCRFPPEEDECMECRFQSAYANAARVTDEWKTQIARMERAEKFEGAEAERQRLETEVEGWAKRVASLVKGCGRVETCKGPTCEATIFFIETKNHRQAPYDLDGTTHFATCTDSGSFQKGRKKK